MIENERSISRRFVDHRRVAIREHVRREETIIDDIQNDKKLAKVARLLLCISAKAAPQLTSRHMPHVDTTQLNDAPC